MDRATMETVYRQVQITRRLHPGAHEVLDELKDQLEQLEEESMEQMAADHKEEWKVVQLDHSCPTGVHSDLLDCNC